MAKQISPMINYFYNGDRYLSFEQLEDRCKQLATQNPEWVSLKEVGLSRAGRSIFCLVIGDQQGEPEKRPAIWVDGGTHAIEWVGVMSALFSASRWVEALSRGDKELTTWFRNNTAIVLPCISPDGFDATRRGSPYIRSTLRPPCDSEVRSGLDMRDMNGDGEVHFMRVKHPGGTMVEDEESPLLMRPRTLNDDAGRAYFLMWEGEFINWDGATWSSAPNKHALDLNRNFPARWTPFSMLGQDSGDYALSEPESRATVEAFAAFPFVCAAVTNHSYSGCILTQPYCANTPLHDADIRLLRALATQLVEGTGYKTYEVNTEFVYDPKKDIVGVWADTITTVFGVPGYTLELWDPYKYAGVNIKKPAEQFFFPKLELLRPVFEKFQELHPELCHAWTPFEHPQLGNVELGGIDYMRAIHNPPEVLLKEECKKGFSVADKLRLILPQVTAKIDVKAIGDDCFEVTLGLQNTGYLATSGTAYGKGLRATPRVLAEISVSADAELITAPARVSLDHMEGWGSLSTGLAAHPLYPELPRNGQRVNARWIVKGRGSVDVQWCAGRAGNGAEAVELSAHREIRVQPSRNHLG